MPNSKGFDVVGNVVIFDGIEVATVKSSIPSYESAFIEALRTWVDPYEAREEGYADGYSAGESDWRNTDKIAALRDENDALAKRVAELEVELDELQHDFTGYAERS